MLDRQLTDIYKDQSGFYSRYWDEPGSVYLLCLSGYLGSDRHKARHYLGWTNDLDQRIRDHRNGKGSKFTQAACQRGLTIRLVEVWQGTRRLEKALKRRHNLKHFCPICDRCKDVSKLTHLSSESAILLEEKEGGTKTPSLTRKITKFYDTSKPIHQAISLQGLKPCYQPHQALHARSDHWNTLY